VTAARPGDELSLRTWAAELEAAASIARQLAPTAFLPDTLRRYEYDERGRALDGKDGRPARLDLDATTATAAAAILTGQELGLKPMASLRSIAVIGNTPALAALTLRAILQHAGHDIWIVESTASRAVVRARRLEDPEIQQSIWTIDRAKTLGLYPGSERSNWRRQPQSMLVARATAEASRWIAADAILGIPYVAEELIDALEEAAAPLALEGPPAAVDGNGQAAAAKAKRTRRKTPAAPPALPAAPPAPPAAIPAEPDPGAGKISKPQLDRMHGELRAVGLDDRETALEMISGWAGRTITTTTELTGVEARKVLAALEKLRSIARPAEEATSDEP
jgi:hypothetical protein